MNMPPRSPLLPTRFSLAVGIAAIAICALQRLSVAQPYFDAPWRSFESSETSVAPSQYLVEVASGDLNGDGLDDVVATQAVFSGGIRVFLNAGQLEGTPATFAEPVFYPTANGAWDIALSDLDGDGDLDVAVSDTDVNGTATNVGIFLNDGSGSLASVAYFAAGPQGPTGITAADFDNDGDADLAVANWGRVGFGDDISVLLNDGTASFSAPLTYAVAASPSRIAAGDLDGDGNADLVVAHDKEAKASILFGEGTGTFGAPVVYSGIFPLSGIGSYASIALLDADVDGDLDIAYTSTYAYDQSVNDGRLAILRNNGSGVFTVQRYPYGLQFENVAFDLAAADLDGDSYPDVLGAQYHESGFLVFRNDGMGGFLPAKAVASADDVIGVATPDLDGDGDPDAATVNRLYPLLGMHENPGDGNFPVLPVFGDAFVHWVLDLGDVNDDGELDAVTSHSGASASTVNVYLGSGDGTFAESYVTPGNAYGYAKLRDLDGDDVLDLLFVSGPSAPPYDFFTARGNGDGTFGTVVRWPVGTCGSAHPAAFDIDGDGDLDVINTEDRGCPGDPDGGKRIFISRNNGDGTFQSAYTVLAGFFPRNVDAGDFNEDGDTDLAVVCGSVDALLFGNGDGTFEPWVAMPGGDYISDNIIVHDWDQDGHDDIAALRVVSTGVSAVGVLWGNGSGAFTPTAPGQHPALSSRLVLATGDVDSDGDDDIFLDGEQDVLVFRNEGAREFTDVGRYGIGRDSRGIDFADVTGDGVGDIVAIVTTEQPSALYCGVAVLPGIGFDPAAVDDAEPVRVGTGFEVGALSPNPFRTRARFQLEVEREQKVTVDLIDTSGRRVRSVFDGTLDAGAPRNLDLDGHGLAGGVYWLAVRGETFETVLRAVRFE